jgi:ribosomal protein S18 acetylase RimI-like enzyme
LDAASERLLRTRAELRGQDPDQNVARVRDALAAGRIEAAVLVDDRGTAQGITAWRWLDQSQTYAQVLFLYTAPESAPASSAALVDHTIATLAAPTTQVIEARLRDDSPGVRDAWHASDFAIFERCRVRRLLGHTSPLPIMPIPQGYRLTAWEDDHLPDAEGIATTAYQGSVESVAVPTHTGGQVVATLRSAHTGTTWFAEASCVALNSHDQVVGYIAITTGSGEAVITDLAVLPDHRRRGLARALLIRGMRACLQQGIPALTATLTTRNPARQLFNQLSFQATPCAEIAIWWRDGRQAAWRG